MKLCANDDILGFLTCAGFPWAHLDGVQELRCSLCLVFWQDSKSKLHPLSEFGIFCPKYLDLFQLLDLSHANVGSSSSGWLLWTCFIGLDSYEYPCRNYGDLGLRIYGPWARHLINFLQALQLLLSVGNIVISNGQAVSQISKFKLCYAVCCLIWAVLGFGIGQIRTLQKFGILANAAVFLNLLLMFITMGVIAHSPPNYGISTLGSAGSATDPASITPVNGVYPPITHYNGLPNPNSITGGINGLMQGVYAYAGAQVSRFIRFIQNQLKITFKNSCSSNSWQN